jgi:hypothetical protein
MILPFISLKENMLEAEGDLNGKYFLGNIAVSLDISEDKVSGFREYYGSFYFK